MVSWLRTLPILILSTAATGGIAWAEESQYRHIEMIDGAVYDGQILGSDGQTMDVLTPRGKVKLPMMDIINLVELSQAEFDALMTVEIAWIGVRSIRSDQKKVAESVGARFQLSLKQMPWTQLSAGPQLTQELGADRAKSLGRCAVDDVPCVTAAMTGSPFDSFVFAVAEPVGDQVRMTFRMVNLEGSLESQPVSVAWRGNSLPPDGSLVQAASVLRGVEPPKQGVGPLTEPPRGGEDPKRPVEPRPSTVSEPSPVATAEGPAKVETPSTPVAKTDGEPLPGGLYPLPGAPAIFANQPEKLLPALGIVGAATGAAVYLVGGVGLTVPWTETQATWADPLFLSGVGLATYLVTTLITNQVMSHTLEPLSTTLHIEAAPGGLTVRF